MILVMGVGRGLSSLSQELLIKSFIAIGLYRRSRDQMFFFFWRSGKNKSARWQARGVMKSYTSEYNTKKLHL